MSLFDVESVEEQHCSEVRLGERLCGVKAAQVRVSVAGSYSVSLIVDDVADSATTIEVPEVGVRELNSWSIWCFDAGWLPDCIVSEVGVYCDSVSFEICHIVSNSESSIAGVCVVLLCDIVR